MFIELHILQNFAPANLNRDDTGSPKECEFGGYRRARISSQCFKRSIRNHDLFTKTTEVTPSERTRWISVRLTKALTDAGLPAEDVRPVAIAFADAYSGKLDRKVKERTAVLLFLSQEEIQEMVDRLMSQWDAVTGDEKTAKAAINGIVKEMEKIYSEYTRAPDIALFGRMLADKPKLNLEASCQVAHAISTHRLAMEMDYYTAVDDLVQAGLVEDNEVGAGMIGTIGFNSSCFYRYARVDWQQLLTNLDDDAAMARRTLEGFLRAAIAALPSGKQNSFAAHNPPSFLLAVVREDGMGWNLANAFAKPVTPTHNQSLVERSLAALDTYWSSLCTVYGTKTLHSVAALGVDVSLEETSFAAEARVENLEAWLAQTLDAVAPTTNLSPVGEDDA